MPDVSLIISFYNRIDYLNLVLAGLEIQSFKNFEIIIADDGSDGKSVNAVENLSADFPQIIKHVWHEDKGFRKNRILNKAIQVSSSEYLIFIDGDCVPHPEFIKEHFENKKEKQSLTGRRVNLSKKFTHKLSIENIKNGYLQNGMPGLIFDGILGDSFDVEKGFYFRSQWIRKLFNKKKRGLLGCNFSLFKKDFLEINGFDERYEAPSVGEDSDVQYRLELNGTNIKSLNHIAVQYHLYHKLQERPVKNLELFSEIKAAKIFFTPFGIVQE